MNASTNYWATVHGPGGNANNAYNQAQVAVSGKTVGVGDFSGAFHNYWVNRTPNKLVIGVDKVTLATWTPASLPAGAQWMTDAPMMPTIGFCLLSVPSVGGKLLIDWVRFTSA